MILGGHHYKMGTEPKVSVTRQLYELQELDLELESQGEALKQVISQLGESQIVLATRSKLALESRHVEELRHEQHALEWEVADITSKIAKAEGELYSGRIGSPKELANLQHEIEVLKAKRSELEDKTLEIMEQVEKTIASVDALKGELETMEADWQVEQGKLKVEKERLEAVVASLRQKREMLLAQVSPEFIEFYAELKGQRGTAVARVQQGVCRGCRIALSNAELQRVRSGELVQCGSCGRILFLA